MKAAEFLREMKSQKWTSINNYAYEQLKNCRLKKLTMVGQELVMHIANENLNRRAPTAREVYGAIRCDRKTLRALARAGYLFDPSIMEIGRELFTHRGSYFDADEPVRSIFLDRLTEYCSGPGGRKSWSERFEDARANVYPRHHFAAVSINGLPVYWPIFSLTPPVEIAPRAVELPRILVAPYSLA